MKQPKIRWRTTKGPGPIKRKPDGTFVLRKGTWADKYDVEAQRLVLEALQRWWKVNAHIGETLRCAAYVRQFVEATGGVRPRLEKGLKGATEEVADLLRRKHAVSVLGTSLARAV